MLFIIISGTSLFFGIRDLKRSMKERHKDPAAWTAADHQLMIEKCLQEMKEKAEAEPFISRIYCDCSQTEIEKHISKTDYLELIKKPFEEQQKTIMPWMKHCLDDYLSQSKFYKNQTGEKAGDTIRIK
ncbi:MAG: hypothetical protein MUC87_01375 [Bacteroidia bacterium]|nr:hypothetical protein [Bacteroidia bacterium]